MDKTMMAIYFLILFIVAGAALLAFLCLSKPSDKKNKAGSDPSIASSSTLKNSHQTGTDAKSTAKAKIKEEKPVDPYENLAVANVDDALNLREKPDTDAKVLGTCFRGGGGTILKRKNGWTKIRSGGLEGWLKDDYLVFGDDIKPLAKELGLYIATVSTQTLHVREEASTDSAIVGLAAAEDYYPVLSQETGWVKIQLSVDTSGYVSSDYVTISVKPGRAISIEVRWQRCGGTTGC
ncbi:MAG: SH3 domain-containing protein [Clostridium fessum]